MFRRLGVACCPVRRIQLRFQIWFQLGRPSFCCFPDYRVRQALDVRPRLVYFQVFADKVDESVNIKRLRVHDLRFEHLNHARIMWSVCSGFMVNIFR